MPVPPWEVDLLLPLLACGLAGVVRANALENAFAYVRFTIYDVRFINNVRVAQILFGALTYAEIPLDPSL